MDRRTHTFDTGIWLIHACAICGRQGQALTMKNVTTSADSKHEEKTMTETTSNTAVLDTAFAGLETRDTHAWFGNHHALAGVSLQFPARSVTGLIGPSGCGKSTYLRLLNRMHEFIPGAAMAGEVRLHGQDIYAREVDPQQCD